jgi:hypothetical protein
MWARIELAVRGAIWDVLWRIGTPAVSIPLLGLAALQLAATAAFASPEAAHSFVTSWGSWAVAVALVLDAGTALLRATPLEHAPNGRVRWVRPDRRVAAALLVACGYLALALGFVASLASRERLQFRCAVGEEFTSSREQVVSRDPPRTMSPGPFPVQFMLESGAGGISRGGGAAPDWIQAQEPGGRRRRASAWSPLWYGWGRFLRPVGSGHVLRYEISAEQGPVLEGAFAKLDLDPPGKTDSIRIETVPHRVYVRAQPAAPGRSGPPSFEIAIYRGKLRVAAATVPIGGELAFEGHVLSLPEWRPWVQLEMVRDAGIPIALIGAVIAAGGLLLRASIRSRSDRRQEPPTESGGA